jgi:predicted permease
VIVTLTLGIGARTAMFSVVNGVLLEPLPFDDARELVLIRHYNRPIEVERDALSIGTFREVTRETAGFSRVGGVAPFDWNVTIGTDEGPARFAGQFASASLLDVLGVRPALGRWFLPEEDVAGAPPVVVVSHAFWTTELGADPTSVGSTLTIDGSPAAVVGVMPAGFEFLLTPDLWLPLDQSPLAVREGVRWITGVGRLAGGVGFEAAREEVGAVMDRLAAELPATNAGLEADLLPLREEIVGAVRGPLLALFAGVGFVLLLACANVANLLLTRALARDGEMALRAALGARLPRLGRLLLVEGLVLASVGSLLGLVCAQWILDGLRSSGGLDLPRLAAIGMDGRVLAFLALVTGLAGLLAALGPLLHLADGNLRAPLNSGTKTATTRSRRIQGGLVASQVALAVVLLVGSGLLARSFTSLLDVDPGFASDGVLTFQVGIPAESYPSAEEHLQYVDGLLARIEALPGVSEAGATTRLPLMGSSLTTTLEVESRPAPVQEHTEVEYRRITPGYLSSMGVRLVEGRDFLPAEMLEEGFAVLVNEAAAERLWPGGSAIAERVRFSTTEPGADEPWFTVVGVVQNVRHFGLGEAARPEVYFSFAGSPPTSPIVAVRASVAPASLLAEVRAAVREVDPNVTLWELATMNDRLAGSLARRRLGLSIVGGFGALALVLAALGVYGVVSHSVGARGREIGIRIAMGARGSQVTASVLGAGLIPVLGGLGLGLGAAFAGSDVLSGFLHGVGPRDPLIFAVVTLLLGGTGVLATLIPARRAARTDPMFALRKD